MSVLRRQKVLLVRKHLVHHRLKKKLLSKRNNARIFLIIFILDLMHNHQSQHIDFNSGVMNKIHST